jgi:molecular chaperone DnaK
MPAPFSPQRSAALGAGTLASNPFGVLQTPQPSYTPPQPNYAPPQPSSAPPAYGGGFEPVPVSRSAPPAPLLIDVTPLTLAVETVNGFCDPVIERNTQVPCERTRVFVTARDNQTKVSVRIAQGESSQFAQNTLLGEVELSSLGPAPRGEVQIAVSFSLDTNGMLNVSAKEVATGRATATQVRLIALPEAGDIARMTQRNAARQL